MGTAPATTQRSLALLDHAVSYTRRALAPVTDERYDAPTPCAGWSLRDLLRHMDDSLAAFTQAAELGRVDLAPRPADPSPVLLAGRLRTRACALLDAWHESVDGADPGEIRIGAGALHPGVVAGIGALEITVHGWDVARALDLEHPIPEPLAASLLEVAADVVGEADRPERFAPAVPTDAPGSADRLLAFLGR